ncbi:MAG: hypothetical protein ABIY55_00415 [Kofleriaceae bacterium]
MPVVDASAIDAAAPVDAVPVDTTPACQPVVLLFGGLDVGPQGWSTIMQPPATVSYGLDYVRLETTTPAMGTVGGQLLLHFPGAFEAGKPFKVQIVLLVESVNPHNQFDAGAAILGSFAPPFGAGDDRNQMIYLDSAALGWADDTQSFAAAIQDHDYHVYELAVGADQVARVTIDGTAALMRNNFAFNGALAIGDESNDPNVDSVLQIRSVTKLCP